MRKEPMRLFCARLRCNNLISLKAKYEAIMQMDGRAARLPSRQRAASLWPVAGILVILFGAAS